MLRLNLGDLVEWDGAEYVVAAAAAGGTLLQRLADGGRVWVDLPTLTVRGEITVSGRQRPAGEGGTAEFESFTAEDVARARWWEPHINEVIYGVPDPGDPTLVPRPGYEDASKTRRRELKARELSAVHRCHRPHPGT